MSVHSLEAPQPNIDPWTAFWTLYPRREAKKDALKAWMQIPPSEHNAILEAVVAWRNVWRQQNRATHHIALPATWLRGERWNDEIPPELLPHSAAPLPAPGGMGEVANRGPIPASVQKVLDQQMRRR